MVEGRAVNEGSVSRQLWLEGRPAIAEELEVMRAAMLAEETGGAPAEPEEPAAGARIYVVQPGDCLWTIARQELGGGLRWVEIYDANRDQIQDPDRIQAGMELELPA